MNGRTIARRAGWCVTLTLLGGAIYFFTEHLSRIERFKSWQVAEPVRLAVDWSEANAYTARFVQTCSSSHGEVLWLETDPEFTDETNALLAVSGLQGQLRITGPTNEIVAEVGFSGKILVAHQGRSSGDSAYRPALTIPPFRRGDYTLHLAIDAGAPALRGIPQQLVARYKLCGLEIMPAYVAMGLSVGCAVLFVVSAGILVATRRTRTPVETPPPGKLITDSTT